MAKVRGGFRLSDEQAQIVDEVVKSKVTVVSAGAGSGKTHTMVATVLHLVEHGILDGQCIKKVNIDEFALITFTNNAADEMMERLGGAISSRFDKAQKEGNGVAADFWFGQKERLANTFIGTIHSFCSMILRTFGYEERIPHEKEVIMARRHFQRALDEAMNEGMQDEKISPLFHDIEWAPHQMKKYLENIYEHIRGRGRQAAEVLRDTLDQSGDAGSTYRLAVAYMLDKIDQKYRAIKQAKGGVDTNDLLLLTAHLLV